MNKEVDNDFDVDKKGNHIVLPSGWIGFFDDDES